MFPFGLCVKFNSAADTVFDGYQLWRWMPFAGVTVLSEVDERLMIMFGAGA